MLIGESARHESARHESARRWLRADGGVLVVLLAAVVVWAACLLTGTGAAQSQGSSASRASQELLPGAAGPLPAPARCRSCWRPPVRESWQIQLSSTPEPPFPGVGMIELDGFDTPASTVAALHRSRRGRGVVCYIDAGTWENWRPDAGEFPRSLLGRPDGWAGERWLNIARFHGVLGRIMQARARMCRRKGFNAVDFDNMDGYANNTGFRLSQGEQLRYDIFLADTAHRDGLSVALKNDLPQIPVLLRYFDFAVNEQCFQYAECLTSQNGGRFGLNQFVAAHKAVFEIEYHLRRPRFCPAARKDRFNSLLKRVSLGAWRRPCD